jgi:mono/diheme cytochrome c family protein
MRIPHFALLAILLGCAPSASAQDPQRGRLLYETHCGECHYERVHSRVRTRIKDLADLRDEVSRWAAQTTRRFTLDEREDLVQYLNESHYRFGLAPSKPGDKGVPRER